MPNAKMPPNDAPLTSPELYENLHFGQSLMERAARGGTLLQQYKRDAARHTAEVATSSIPQQQADLALKQERYKLFETERGLAQRARLHAEFDLDALGGAIDTIRDLRDPVEQASRINRLRAQYAHFRADPVLARSIDTQLGTLASMVEENRLAWVHERIAANRYARTPEEAAARFPGYLIRPEILPTGQNDRGETQFSPIYLAEDQVDPRLEAEAFAQLRLVNAQNATGQQAAALERLNSLAGHPSVAAVLGVPGSRFADSYIAEIERTRGSTAPSSTTSTPPTTPSSSKNLPEIDQRGTAGPDGRAAKTPVTDRWAWLKEVAYRVGKNSNPLANDLLSHYMRGRGRPYELTLPEMQQVRTRASILNQARPGGPKFSDLLSTARRNLASGGNGRVAVTNLRVAGAAHTNGTLGGLTIIYNGILEATVIGWEFSGQMSFYDYWNFEPHHGTTQRTGAGANDVAAAREWLNGTPFEVTSISVPVTQYSSTNETLWPGAEAWKNAGDFNRRNKGDVF